MTMHTTQTKNPRVYLDGDLIMIRCPWCAEKTVKSKPPKVHDCQNYAIPKSDIQNIVVRFIWVKTLLKINWLSKTDVLEFLTLAEQLAPEMIVALPEMVTER